MEIAIRSLLASVIVMMAWVSEVGAELALPAGKAIDAGYVARFATCDAHDTFGGVHFPIKAASGKIIWYGCKTDPSHFGRFERVPAAGAQPEAVIITSKLGHDEDGSFLACHHAGGPTDQCTTSLMLKSAPHHPCQVQEASGFCVPVNPDEVAYVVIPGSAPRTSPAIDAAAFRRLTGLVIGDYGVVFVGDRVVPVIIADSGPAYKIGEGSTALLKALSVDGKPHPISSGVTFVLFPRTRRPAGEINADTLADDLKGSALGCFKAFMKTAAPEQTCRQSAQSH